MIARYSAPQVGFTSTFKDSPCFTYISRDQTSIQLSLSPISSSRFLFCRQQLLLSSILEIADSLFMSQWIYFCSHATIISTPASQQSMSAITAALNPSLSASLGIVCPPTTKEYLVNTEYPIRDRPAWSATHLRPVTWSLISCHKCKSAVGKAILQDTPIKDINPAKFILSLYNPEFHTTPGLVLACFH